MRPFPARYSGSGCTCIRTHTHTHTHRFAQRRRYCARAMCRKEEQRSAESERQVLSAYNTSSSGALQEQAKKSSAQYVYAFIHKTLVVSQFVRSALLSGKFEFVRVMYKYTYTLRPSKNLRRRCVLYERELRRAQIVIEPNLYAEKGLGDRIASWRPKFAGGNLRNVVVYVLRRSFRERVEPATARDGQPEAMCVYSDDVAMTKLQRASRRSIRSSWIRFMESATSHPCSGSSFAVRRVKRSRSGPNRRFTQPIKLCNLLTLIGRLRVARDIKVVAMAPRVHSWMPTITRSHFVKTPTPLCAASQTTQDATRMCNSEREKYKTNSILYLGSVACRTKLSRAPRSLLLLLLLLLLLPGRISFCSALVSQTLIRGHLRTTAIPIRCCTCRDQRPQVSFPCLAIPTAVSSKNFDTCGSLHKEPVCDLVLLLLYVLLFLQWETARVDAARRINLLNLQLYAINIFSSEADGQKVGEKEPNLSPSIAVLRQVGNSKAHIYTRVLAAAQRSGPKRILSRGRVARIEKTIEQSKVKKSKYRSVAAGKACSGGTTHTRVPDADKIYPSCRARTTRSTGRRSRRGSASTKFFNNYRLIYQTKTDLASTRHTTITDHWSRHMTRTRMSKILKLYRAAYARGQITAANAIGTIADRGAKRERCYIAALYTYEGARRTRSSIVPRAAAGLRVGAEHRRASSVHPRAFFLAAAAAVHVAQLLLRNGEIARLRRATGYQATQPPPRQRRRGSESFLWHPSERFLLGRETDGSRSLSISRYSDWPESEVVATSTANQFYPRRLERMYTRDVCRTASHCTYQIRIHFLMPLALPVLIIYISACTRFKAVNYSINSMRRRTVSDGEGASSVANRPVVPASNRTLPAPILRRSVVPSLYGYITARRSKCSFPRNSSFRSCLTYTYSGYHRYLVYGIRALESASCGSSSYSSSLDSAI
ncbi:unnamed protein product [Trichogramma brassicae]|uniref:Uncharacterized protein n=1 Tax=Trichogramma brassicae TaxID=86971 RepID=A0A6H5IGW9_9HYME|nr:unnamed protein product [Trichogramma brassicae]